MYSIEQIARWFTEKDDGQIASIKLQKLCYYAQAWSYALHDVPLFDGKFEAWVHGPVNRTLWEKFRPIAYRNITFDDFTPDRNVIFEDKELELLELVWNTYGEFSGYQLEALTRLELPWKDQRIGMDAYRACTKEINTNTMKAFYRSLYSQDGIN